MQLLTIVYSSVGPICSLFSVKTPCNFSQPAAKTCLPPAVPGATGVKVTESWHFRAGFSLIKIVYKAVSKSGSIYQSGTGNHPLNNWAQVNWILDGTINRANKQGLPRIVRRVHRPSLVKQFLVPAQEIRLATVEFYPESCCTVRIVQVYNASAGDFATLQCSPNGALRNFGHQGNMGSMPHNLLSYETLSSGKMVRMLTWSYTGTWQHNAVGQWTDSLVCYCSQLGDRTYWRSFSRGGLDTPWFLQFWPRNHLGFWIPLLSSSGSVTATTESGLHLLAYAFYPLRHIVQMF